MIDSGYLYHDFYYIEPIKISFYSRIHCKSSRIEDATETAPDGSHSLNFNVNLIAGSTTGNASADGSLSALAWQRCLDFIFPMATLCKQV